MTEIHKDSNGDTISLEGYRIVRLKDAGAVTVRARLVMKTPNDTPKELRVTVEYETDDIGIRNEKHLGDRIVSYLKNRVASVY